MEAKWYLILIVILVLLFKLRGSRNRSEILMGSIDPFAAPSKPFSRYEGEAGDSNHGQNDLRGELTLFRDRV
jgi:hypothetical protein